jgi:hypothetical protein
MDETAASITIHLRSRRQLCFSRIVDDFLQLARSAVSHPADQIEVVPTSLPNQDARLVDLWSKGSLPLRVIRVDPALPRK